MKHVGPRVVEESERWEAGRHVERPVLVVLVPPSGQEEHAAERVLRLPGTVEAGKEPEPGGSDTVSNVLSEHRLRRDEEAGVEVHGLGPGLGHPLGRAGLDQRVL